MKHFALPDFWTCYHRLPKQIQQVADACYALLKRDPAHPWLHFKKIGKFRAVRIGLHYRALAVEVEDGLLWFWIGSHSEYDKILSQQIRFYEKEVKTCSFAFGISSPQAVLRIRALRPEDTLRRSSLSPSSTPTALASKSPDPTFVCCWSHCRSGSP